MKNRKFAVVAFLLVAAMLLGVGYATLTDNLVINGTATVTQTTAENEFNQDIYFSNATTTSTGVTAVVEQSDNDKGTITIADGALKNGGESVTATYTILNNGELDAVVAVPTIENNNPTYFKVETNWGDADQTLTANGDTIDVTVTITLLQTPVTEQSATFSVSFVATSDDTTIPTP